MTSASKSAKLAGTYVADVSLLAAFANQKLRKRAISPEFHKPHEIIKSIATVTVERVVCDSELVSDVVGVLSVSIHDV
ncbi:MAG: hypothetical protein ALECFALPRED_005805 [Alectoria fallacina]|uniref:Uncharacterized protein n=1 Tax=Alectoria fallacina TaxID=1903189 RepID=A0A8H3IUD3_9LECA|nr:MAG: hypothetical protein ALECFALPRED_005805 [Alectoria fallacina]